MEECKTLPFSVVWDKLCLKAKVPVGADWLGEVYDHEAKTLSKRK
jgi:L-rhamnose isomerase